MASNPPLGRSWRAYPRHRKKTAKREYKEQSTQTPEIRTLASHSEQHEALESKARAFAVWLEKKGLAAEFEAHFPRYTVRVGSEVETRSVVILRLDLTLSQLRRSTSSRSQRRDVSDVIRPVP